MRLYAAFATLAIVAAPVRADEPAQVRGQAPAPAPPPPPPSLTLRQGVVALHVAFELSAAKGDVLAPASVAPDLSVGVTDWLTLSAISSGSALTGFRGSAGWGVCMTGTDDNCRTRYTAGGAETLVSLSRGSLALAGNVGVLWTSLDPRLHTDLKVGFKMKLSEGNVFALLSPNVWIPLDERYDRVIPHERLLFVPVSLWAKPSPKLAIGLATGVKGPLEDFKDRASIPAGVLFQLAMSRYVGFGSSLVFGKVVGGSAVMDPGVDARVLQVWLNVSSG